MTKEQLRLKPIDLKVDGLVLKDCVNVNDMRWHLDKTVEELIELADSIIHYKRDKVAEEQLCAEIGDVFIQIAILAKMFNVDIIQQMVNSKLVKIAIRSQKIKTKHTFGGKAGFKV